MRKIETTIAIRDKQKDKSKIQFPVIIVNAWDAISNIQVATPSASVRNSFKVISISYPLKIKDTRRVITPAAIKKVNMVPFPDPKDKVSVQDIKSENKLTIKSKTEVITSLSYRII